ncbi:MAG: hypothetical protein ACYDEQ_08365 [Desulfocucumaceae bacterium]
MEKECDLIKYFKDKYSREIQEIIEREQVTWEVAICSHLCPEVIGCVEDVEEKACALRLRMINNV